MRFTSGVCPFITASNCCRLIVSCSSRNAATCCSCSACSCQNRFTFLIGRVDERFDLVIDVSSDLFGIGFGLFVITADKDLVVRAVAYSTQFFTHTVAGDHLAGNGAGAVDIIGCAGGDVVQKQLFATRPPRNETICSNISLRERKLRSSAGREMVMPPAPPRGTMVI